MSPWAGSEVCDTSTVGTSASTGTGGRVPSRMAAAQAGLDCRADGGAHRFRLVRRGVSAAELGMGRHSLRERQAREPSASGVPPPTAIDACSTSSTASRTRRARHPALRRNNAYPMVRVAARRRASPPRGTDARRCPADRRRRRRCRIGIAHELERRAKNAGSGFETPISSLIAMTSESMPRARSSCAPFGGLIGDDRRPETRAAGAPRSPVARPDRGRRVGTRRSVAERRQQRPPIGPSHRSRTRAGGRRRGDHGTDTRPGT